MLRFPEHQERCDLQEGDFACSCNKDEATAFHDKVCGSIRYPGTKCNCSLPRRTQGIKVAGAGTIGDGHRYNSYTGTYEIVRPEPPQQPRRQDMSAIHICERCSALATGKALGLVQVKLNGDYDAGDPEYVTKEICPDCVAKILALVETDAEKVNDAYQKGYKRPKPHTDDVEAATAEQLAAALFEKLLRQNAIEGTVVDK